jgi:hypothetical protein
MVQAVLEIATPDRFYPSPHRCIYCGRKAGKLTKEHIIPFGLAGDALVLRKGSCRKCADETKKHETSVLRHMWWPFRTHIGIPTRHDAGSHRPGVGSSRRPHPCRPIDMGAGPSLETAGSVTKLRDEKRGNEIRFATP